MQYPSISIEKALDKIEKNEYFIPDLQREFVWSEEQIELLFDSIMRGFPVGTMLFWEVQGETKFKYRFYEFVRNYKEYFTTYGKLFKFDKIQDEKTKITAVLDGQQRLTAFYIGLRGSYSTKKPRVAIKDKETNFYTKKLYLQIDGEISESDDDDRVHNFKFFTEEQFLLKGGESKWFPVSLVFETKKSTDLHFNKTLQSNQNALRRVLDLHDKIFTQSVLNYYIEEDQDIDKALNIFIRMNNQGEPLSFTDLIFSLIISNWKYRDAKKSFNDLINELYETDFNVSKDFVLKLFLILHNDNIKFRMQNFSNEMARSLEDNWDKLSDTLKFVAKKLKEIGYGGKLLTSKNAVIPILYIFYNVKDREDYFQKNKTDIKSWLSAILYLQAFGRSSDNILKKTRDWLREYNYHASEKFPKNEIYSVFKSWQYISVPDDDFIESSLFSSKSAQYFQIVSLLFSDKNIQPDQFIEIIPKLTASQIRKLDLNSEEKANLTDYLKSFMNYVFMADKEILWEKNVSPEILKLFDGKANVTRENYKWILAQFENRKINLIGQIKEELVNI